MGFRDGHCLNSEELTTLTLLLLLNSMQSLSEEEESIGFCGRHVIPSPAHCYGKRGTNTVLP